MEKKHEIKKKKSGGYRGQRNENGLTPRQLLDSRKAELLQMEILQKQGELCRKDEVLAGLKEAAEVIQSDLYGTLVSKLVSALAGRKTPPSRFHEACTAIVDEIVKSWEKNSLVAKAG